MRKAVEFLSRVRRESKGTLIIGLIDLDHFKSINDRFGHAVGDQLLQRFAAALRTSLHTREVFGRYGGEEFLVLFPDTTMDQARQSAERLRTALRDQHMRVDDQDVAVTLSLGLAGYESRRRVVRPGRAARRYRACTSPRRRAAIASRSSTPRAMATCAAQRLAVAAPRNWRTEQASSRALAQSRNVAISRPAIYFR